MRFSGNPEYAKLLGSIKHCQRLKRLTISVNLKQDLVELLNKNIGKDTNLKSLAIQFANYMNTSSSSSSIAGAAADANYEIKFHKYLKNLRSLTLVNISDRNFSETMFDMASIRKMKELNLSFTPDLSLPGFSQALSKFT